MSKEKIANSDARKTPVVPGVRNSGIVENAKSPEPEIVALEIEDNDFGSDPYNRTGSFCVLKFDKDH
jgi:hypothetical protein